MKRKLTIVVGLLVVAFAFFVKVSMENNNELASNEDIRSKHEKFLNDSPFKNTDDLTKKERFEKGLPPNKYLEREWELTMNPNLGRPTPENLNQIRRSLEDQRLSEVLAGRVPGDAADNSWVERGPNNVGGRCRAVMFDPNDPNDETVFAGGVSGGLWKNTNISNANSEWTRVDIRKI